MMRKNKRAQGLSLNVVIIGVILLIVLAVVLIIFNGGMGRFSSGTECPPNHCKNKQTDCNAQEYAIPMKCKLGSGGTSVGTYCCYPK